MIAAEQAEKEFAAVANQWAEKLRGKPPSEEFDRVIDSPAVKAFVNRLLALYGEEPLERVTVRDILNARIAYQQYKFCSQNCTTSIPPGCPITLFILRNRGGKANAEQAICPVWLKWKYYLPLILEKAPNPSAIARKFGAEKIEELDLKTLIKVWRQLKEE